MYRARARRSLESYPAAAACLPGLHWLTVALVVAAYAPNSPFANSTVRL